MISQKAPASLAAPPVRVTVRSACPALSTTVSVAGLNCTVPAASLSVIVTTAVAGAPRLESPAGAGLSSARKILRAPSTLVLETVFSGIGTTWLDWPAANVSTWSTAA